MSKIALALQKNLERCTSPGNDRASFGIVADALTTGEPSLRRRARVYARRRLQAFDQAGRAIVVAHAIKCIGHCRVYLLVWKLDLGPLPASDYSR